mgnify:CR=1 FL=1
MLELPQSGSTITADVTYNLAQAGKLAIDTQSNFQLQLGSPGFTSEIPNTQTNTLALYDIKLRAGIVIYSPPL